MKVLQGTDATADPKDPGSTYSGTYALEQRISGGREGLAFAGAINVENFAVVDAGAKPSATAGRAPARGGFSERAIRIANDSTFGLAGSVVVSRTRDG